MKNTKTDRVLAEGVCPEKVFTPDDGINITPRLKKDGTIMLGSFRSVLTTLKDFVIVGGDFV